MSRRKWTCTQCGATPDQRHKTMCSHRRGKPELGPLQSAATRKTVPLGIPGDFELVVSRAAAGRSNFVRIGILSINGETSVPVPRLAAKAFAESILEECDGS